MTFIYLDTETTGLDPLIHEVWEIAYATDSGPIARATVPHFGLTSDPAALEIGRYEQREGASTSALHYSFERGLIDALGGATLVGANPAFDAAFLRARWSVAPWHHRLLDIEAYAMPAFGWDKPRGLKDVAAALRERGYEIPEPDHTAAGDVACVRACHLALRVIYGGAS